MHDQLTTSDKVRHGVLPHEGLIIAFVIDDGRNSRITHLSLLDLSLHISYGITHRAGDGRCVLCCLKLATAGAATEVYEIAVVFICHQLCLAYRALGIFAFCLIVDHIIAA